MQEEFCLSPFQVPQRHHNDLALAKFSEFLRPYPTSLLAANAKYLNGEGYFRSQQFDAAIRDFELVLKYNFADEKAVVAFF